MSIEKFPSQFSEFPSKLEILAAAILDKETNITELDRPVVLILTQETRSELPPMSEETRLKFKEKEFPNSILDAIGSEAEALIYNQDSLEPAIINNKDVLIKTDIDIHQKDGLDQTNLDRMKAGKAPLDKNGNPIELHHIGQKNDSPLVELTREEHRGVGNDNILHNKQKESEIDRSEFNKERAEHWKQRAASITSP